MDELVVSTDALNQYAIRLQNVNFRIARLDGRMDSLYWRVGLLDLWNLIQADALTSYNFRLRRCQSYLEQTAREFEKAESDIQNADPLNFQVPDILQALLESMAPHTTCPGFGPQILGPLMPLLGQEHILEQIGQALGDGWESCGEFMDLMDSIYDSLSREEQAGVNIVVNSLIPSEIIDTYTLVSGIVQGDLTMEDVFDVAGHLAAKNLYASVIVEAIEYSLTDAQEALQEMDDAIAQQFREGDLLGAGLECAEGFVDIILGGSLETLANAGGNMLDGFIGDIPIAGPMLDEGVQYFTGKLLGEEYSPGELLGLVGEGASDLLDTATDYTTEFLDGAGEALSEGLSAVGEGIAEGAMAVGEGIAEGAMAVGEGISDGVEAVGSWLGSLF